MAFFSKVFSKTADDYLAKGERLFEQERYYEARSVYENGLQRYPDNKNGDSADSTSTVFLAKIALANRALAELNLREAKHAITSGAYDKAAEHLELAKTLTDDLQLREKAEAMLASLAEKVDEAEKNNETNRLASSGGSCRSCASKVPETDADTHNDTTDLSLSDYYDLLIRQLPGEMYSRYATLGDEFASMYLAVSKDDHENALELLENWFEGDFRDIYCYEKGMILYRTGNARLAEECLLDSIGENSANPLPHLGLALLLIESERFDEALDRLDVMIADDILSEHALLLRGDVFQMRGDSDGAIRCYGMLLSSAYSRPAAEKLHDVLMHCDRLQEAENVFKSYIKGCGH
ncbi:MAG: hypothetical protein WC156_05310 [Pedobacter sp.]